VHALLIDACFQATRRMLAVTPYFVPDVSLETAMRLAARRGVKIDLCIPAKSNHILADFVRKSQLANYEAYRAMYEGRNAQLFHPTTALLTWMSHPAQPSFVWQLYHYDFEPNSSLFAVKKAAELTHIQFNEENGELQVINNLPTPLNDVTAKLSVYNLDGSIAYQHEYKVTAPADAATGLGPIQWPATLSSVHFLKLELHDATGKLLSDNFYWRALPEHQDDLTDLAKLPTVTLNAQITRKDADGKSLITVTLHNPTANLAVMTHLQLRRKRGDERVLPVYYSDNYVSLTPNETKIITIEADRSSLKGEDALVVLDGWNTSVTPSSSRGAAITLNINAQVDHWPVTGLPFQTTGLR